MQEGKQKNYKNGFLFFLWGVLWLFFAYFRMKGFFDIYGLLMWGAAFYIGFKILKQINLRNILDLLLLASALSAAYGICQSLLYDFLWTFDFSKSLGSIGVSTFGNPNFLASFLLFNLPLSMVFYLSASDKAENIYYFTINLIGCTFVALSQTRSAWIGLFFSFLVLISSKNFRNLLFRNKVKIGVLMATLVVLFLIWPENKTSIDKIYDIKIASQSIFKNPKNLTLSANRNALNMAYHQRLMAWTCGIKNLKKHPLLGTGWGSWQLNYAKCQGELLNKYPALEEFKTQSNAAHNLLIEIITQSGVLGFLAYIVFGILVFLNFLRYYRQENDINKKVFFLAVFASCLGFFADSMLNISYQIQKIGAVFSFLVGILASLNLEKKIKISSTKNNLLLGGVLIFFLFFSFKQFNHLLASHYSLRGYLSVKENNYNKADKLFKKSLNFSKENPETQFAELKVLEQLKNY
ncbi:MAG: O-antigen ligase family protein, partial [Campylobacter sp.]|nr:O-antigen ligase family protein [Campylobacter sp.]